MSDKNGELEKRPCLLCKKMLEPAIDSWDTLQPYGGGEIRLLFGYGSTKFDNHMWGTTFKALICDECAEKLVPDMEGSGKHSSITQEELDAAYEDGFFNDAIDELLKEQEGEGTG